MSCEDTCESTTVTLYKDRDNALTVVPYADYTERTNYDMDAVVRVTVDADAIDSVTTGDAIVGDSDVDDTLVWWAQVLNSEDILEWRIFAKVGMFSGIVAGDYTLRITLFDANNTNGLVLPSSDSALIVTIVEVP